MTYTTFFGLPFHTIPGEVMTPRVSSEELVEAACRRIGDREARVVDVGTGSGAIAIAIATACPNAEVWGTDTSHAAVALARANVRLHRLEDRVHVRHGSLLDPVPGKVDLIVANLPYLPISLAPDRPELAGEPENAVFAPGDGLDPYRRLLEAAPASLRHLGEVLIQLHRQVVPIGA
jgi:release factor glutamine methyltransferase